MTNLYEHGLYLSLYPPLPSLYSNPWRGQVFPLILFTSLSLHSQSPRTQQQPSPPSSANNNKVSQVENYYVRLSSSRPNPPPRPASLFFSCTPAICPTSETGRCRSHRDHWEKTDTSAPQRPAPLIRVVTPSSKSLIMVQSGFLPPERLVQRCSVGPV